MGSYEKKVLKYFIEWFSNTIFDESQQIYVIFLFKFIKLKV